MKVVCDNCGAMYKIPDDKLVKPVNKATCRQCGHRMLIPRPRRGADPDERTLVTAVPPTPAPPPMRDDSGPPTTPLHADSEEKTLPTGGPAPEETRWIRNELAGASKGAAAVAAEPAKSSPASGGAMTERLPAHGGAATPQPHRQTPSPRPAPLLEDIDLAAESETHDDDDDAPAPRADKGRSAKGGKSSKGGKASKSPASSHDPRADMGLALFGVIVAGIGVVILGVDAVLDASAGWYWAVIGSAFLGTALAVGGLIGAFLVLVTSGRGRKPAWKVVAVVLGVLFGLVAGAVPAGVRVSVDTVSASGQALTGLFDGVAQELAEPSLADITPAPEPEPEAPQDADADPAADAATDADPTADAEIEPAEAPAADASTESAEPEPAAAARTTSTASTRSSSGTSAPTSTSTSTRTPTRIITTSEPEPARTRTAPADEKVLPDDLDDLPAARTRSTNPDLPEKPPMQAIDIMVKTNVNVKRCFFEYQKAEGKLPARLDVPFTIKPNGDAADISIKQSKYAGGALEACLIKSIRGIAFPPSQKGTTLTFPFVFT